MDKESNYKVTLTQHGAEKAFVDDNNKGRVFARKVQKSGEEGIKKSLVIELTGLNLSSPDRKVTTVTKELPLNDAARISSAALQIAKSVEESRLPPVTRSYMERVTDAVDGVRLGASGSADSKMSYFIEGSDDGRSVRCHIGKVEDLHELMDLCATALNY